MMTRFTKLEIQTSPQVEQAIPIPVRRDEAYFLTRAADSIENGNFENALRDYAKALEQNPKNPASWTGQVRMLIELDEFKEAKLWADKTLEMFPHDSELLAAKSVALARMGDFKAAMAFSDASFSERGNSTYLWIARGDVLLAQKESRADHCFDRAISMDPSNWLSFWFISRINAHYGRAVQALVAVQSALSLETSRVQLWLQAAWCQQELGLQNAAIESCQNALRLEPQNAEARDILNHSGSTPPLFSWFRRVKSLFRR